MLSIGAMAAGQESYYLTLAREDYYLEGGEPPGRWLGSGAKRLGLDGTVSRHELEELFKGKSPDDSSPLVQLQRGRTHQPGWDLTFSAPKSVSVLWSQADYELRQALQDAHFKAVQFSVDYLEQNAAFTRRGHGGVDRERCGLVVATFEHGTSRAQDPQLHTHALVMNVAARSDGTFGTLSSHDLYLNKMLAGVLYRTQLAHECSRLGFELGRGEHSFELACVPAKLSEHFSTRRQQILDTLAREGLSGPVASSLAALSTREVKGHVAREELMGFWKAVGEEHGFSTKEVLAALAPRFAKTEAEQFMRLRLATGKAIDTLSDKNGNFTESQLLRKVAAAVEHEGIDGKQVSQYVRSIVRDQLEVVQEGPDSPRFATKELVEVERRLLGNAEASKSNRSHAVSEKTVEAVRRSRTLNAEQDAALRRITTDAGAIQCVEGMAGTGKTYMLGAAREAWEKQGLRVIGASLAARAARELEVGSGIKSDTLAKTLWLLDRPLTDKLKHHGKQLWETAKLDISLDARGFTEKGKRKVRKAFAKHTPKLDSLSLDSKSVVVIDEAGMIGTKELERLVGLTTKAGAKLVLVGDHRQLQAIDGGAPFRFLAERLGAAKLTEIIRQYEPWMVNAVKQFAEGDARGALTQYALAQKLSVADTRADAIQKLIQDWNQKRTAELKESLILAGTRAETKDLNLLAQDARRQQGELGTRSIRVGENLYFEGDRIVFTKNSRPLGVSNGDFGTIENIRGLLSSPLTPLTIRLDHEDEHGKPVRVTLTPAAYKDLELGYAVTTHKAQGATVDRTFVLGGGWMQDRELSYVQMSRHREDCHIYTSVADAGEDLDALSQSMSHSRMKGMALDPEKERREREAFL